MRARFSVVLLLFFGIVQSLYADTTWVSGGNVSGEWTRDGSPYMLMSGVGIAGGTTLSIGPGVTVFFMVNFIFGVSPGARLEAVGAEGDSIYFTTDTLLNPEQWEGIWTYAASDTCRLEYCVVEYATTPGFGANWFFGPTVLRSSTFRNNSAQYGGAVYGSFAYLDISNCVFERNRAAGGGVFHAVEIHGVIQGCVFRNNRATVGNGGVFEFNSQHDGLVVRACDFIDNTSEGNGGAVYLVTGNTSLVFQECRFISNHAGGNGGAVGSQVNWASAGFDSCLFDGNQAGGNGGALQVCFSTVADHCVFRNNAALNGGAIYAEIAYPQTPTVSFCTLVGNSASGRGGGIYLVDWASVRNCIVAFGENGEGIVLPSRGEPMQARPAFNLIFGNADGAFSFNEAQYGIVDTVNANGDPCDAYSNIFLDPQFVDAEEDYHLRDTSPCIDAGDPHSDLDPDGTVADMGAYYFEQLSTPEGGRIELRGYGLSQNYPNPFNAQTRISFEVARAGMVKLDVFDITGRNVQTLVNGVVAAGAHEVNIDAGSLPSGIYLYRLDAGGYMKARKMILLR